jgi:hypothetical protein
VGPPEKDGVSVAYAENPTGKLPVHTPSVFAVENTQNVLDFSCNKRNSPEAQVKMKKKRFGNYRRTVVMK